MSIKFLWRILRGRCHLCGGKKFHRRGDIYSSIPQWCRHCTKIRNHALNYGMSR